MNRKIIALIITGLLVLAVVVFTTYIGEKGVTPSTPTPAPTPKGETPIPIPSPKPAPTTPKEVKRAKYGTHEIQKIVYPSYVDFGRDIPLTVVVKNKGSRPAKFCIRVVYIKGNTTYSYVYTPAINPILDVEEERTFEFNYTPSEMAKGKMDLTVQACVYPSVVPPGGWVKVTPVDEIKISVYIGEKERRGD